MVAMARKTPSRARGKGACAFCVSRAPAYAPMAMNPAFASESWPQQSVQYTERASSPLSPMKAKSDWYVRKKPARSGTSGLADGGLPEQAGGPDEQHQEEHAEGDRVAPAGAQLHDGQDLEQAEREPGDHRARDTAHASQDDHREPLQLHAPAHVRRDAVE